MEDEILFENLDSLDEIDTSDIDDFDDSSDNDIDFYDTVVMDNYVETEDLADYDGITEASNPFETADTDEIHTHHHAEHNHSSSISFGLGCHCMVHGCGCKSFEGTYGCVCTNCYHGYDKHF